MARKVKPHKTTSDWMTLKTSARFKIEFFKIEFQYNINCMYSETFLYRFELIYYIRHCKLISLKLKLI